MATNIELVQQLYVAYFNRPGDVGGVNFYTSVLESHATTIDAIAADFAKSAEYQNQFKDKVAEEVIDIVYMNMFGRHAEKAALDFYGPLIQNGTITIDKVVLDIVKGAQGTDLTAYESKVTAAAEFTEFLDTAGNEQARVAYASGKGDVLQIARDYLIKVTDAATLATAVSGLATTGAELTGELNEGQTIVLTKGLDTVKGGAGNDLIIGSVDATAGTEVNTISPIDSVDGGAGIDTLKIVSVTALNSSALPTITNVETINLESASTITFNSAAATGVTTLNVNKSAGAVLVDSGATTDVNVTLSLAANTGAIDVDGGKNVTVKATDVVTTSGDIFVGADSDGVGADGAVSAAGAVVVSSTGAASVAGSSQTLSAITVTGGSTINVTQKATSDAAAAAADTTGATITQGAVTIDAGTTTTAVTVKQDAHVDGYAAQSAISAKATTKEVVFTAMAKNDVVTIDFGTGTLTFTANKALTAAEAASAFANLAKGVKQGNASASLGIYSNDAAGGVTDNWTSGAVQTVDATHSKVVFSSSTAAADLDVVAGALLAVDQNLVAGTAAQAGYAGELGVANGVVDIDDSAGNTLKTITIDGYADNSVIGANVATANLATLNLANAELTDGADVDALVGDITIADTAATLDLNLENIGTSYYNDGDAASTDIYASVTFTAAPTTLNVKSTGDNLVVLGAAATTALNVSGTGALDISDAGTDLAAVKSIKVTGTASLFTNGGESDSVESVDTTGTTGTVMTSIEGNRATYTGGAGTDIVSVTNASTAISKSINLGGGNDSLNLSATDAIDPTVELNGGEGTDTITLSAAAAAARSASTTFETKITGFEKLGIGAVVSGSNLTVDMSNMDDINYVISANAPATVAGTQEVQTFTVATGVTATKTNQTRTLDFTGVAVGAGAGDGGTFTIAGVNVVVADNATTADIVTAVVTALNGATPAGTTQAIRATAAGDVVTFTFDTRDGAGIAMPLAVGDVVFTAAPPAAAAAGTAFNANAPTIVVGGVNVALVAGDLTATGAAVAGSGDNTADEVAAKIAAALDANGTYDAAGTSSTGAAVTVKWAAVGDQGAIGFTAAGGVSIGAIGQTNGSAGSASGSLIIDKLANNGTLEVTKAGAGVEVRITDATTGTADVLNIVTKAATGANLGTIVADKVETVKINAIDTDSTTTASGAANTSTNTMTLDADKATTITVGGSGRLVLNLHADSTAVSLIDASASTGRLTVATLASDLGATTVKGSSGNDTLTAQGANDVLQGNAGADTLKVVGNAASAVTLTGGDGVDLFDVSLFRAANAGAAATVTDLAKGEMIKFSADADANFASSKVVLIAEATFDNYVTEAAKAADLASAGDHGIAWFQFGGNTFIVQDVDGSGAFEANNDIIVKITGAVDLSNSSFNEVDQGTLLYI